MNALGRMLGIKTENKENKIENKQPKKPEDVKKETTSITARRQLPPTPTATASSAPKTLIVKHMTKEEANVLKGQCTEYFKIKEEYEEQKAARHFAFEQQQLELDKTYAIAHENELTARRERAELKVKIAADKIKLANLITEETGKRDQQFNNDADFFKEKLHSLPINWESTAQSPQLLNAFCIKITQVISLIELFLIDFKGQYNEDIASKELQLNTEISRIKSGIAGIESLKKNI